MSIRIWKVEQWQCVHVAGLETAPISRISVDILVVATCPPPPLSPTPILPLPPSRKICLRNAVSDSFMKREMWKLQCWEDAYFDRDFKFCWSSRLFALILARCQRVVDYNYASQRTVLCAFATTTLQRQLLYAKLAVCAKSVCFASAWCCFLNWNCGNDLTLVYGFRCVFESLWLHDICWFVVDGIECWGAVVGVGCAVVRTMRWHNFRLSLYCREEVYNDNIHIVLTASIFSSLMRRYYTDYIRRM